MTVKIKWDKRNDNDGFWVIVELLAYNLKIVKTIMESV